jgi:hypothetical protein
VPLTPLLSASESCRALSISSVPELRVYTGDSQSNNARSINEFIPGTRFRAYCFTLNFKVI